MSFMHKDIFIYDGVIPNTNINISIKFFIIQFFVYCTHVSSHYIMVTYQNQTSKQLKMISNKYPTRV